MAATMRGAVCRLSKVNWRPNQVNRTIASRKYSQEVAKYEDEVKYPEIRQKYPPGKWDATNITPSMAWYRYQKGQELLELEDVRERLEKISGEKDKLIYQVQRWSTAPRTLGYKQFITRTHFINDLPDVYDSVNVNEEYDQLQPLLQNAIIQENESSSRRKDVQSTAERVFSSLINVILAGCSHNCEHLLRSQVDRHVRVESYWQTTFPSMSKEDEKSVKQIWMQYKGETSCQIRTEMPLPEFVPVEDDICRNGDYPHIEYGPRNVGQKYLLERPLSVSGHWIGDPCEFTHLSCQGMNHEYQEYLSKYAEYPELLDEFWLQCGFLTSFGSCLAQAHNQGFNIYQDVTYPFTTQTAVLEGNTIQLFAYQMNTFHLWLDRLDNTLNNVLWVGKKQNLFDVNEDGQIDGMNDEAFKQLLKCFLLKSVDRGYDLRPHLSKDKAPVNKRQYFNHVDEPVFDVPKIGRWQYPRKALYF